MHRTLWVLFFAALPGLPAQAAESFDGCQFEIASIPATVTSSGVWCVKHDLATAISSGAAITVAANNVIVDCNGFRLGGLAAGTATQTQGVYAENRQNMIVRNCLLRGFQVGVRTHEGSGHIIEDNKVDGSTVAGLIIMSQQSTIRRNQILDTGGSTDGAWYAKGIWTRYETDILDNTISGVHPVAGHPAGEAWGIHADIGKNFSITGNRIRDVAGSFVSYGIFLDGDQSVIEGNHLLGISGGVVGSITCQGTENASARNVIVGYDYGVVGCVSTGDLHVGSP